MDRRSLMVGFVGFAGFGVLAPTLLPMPLEARGLLLGAGSLSMTGAAVMAWDDRQYVGHRSALRRSESVGVQERLTAQHAYQSAVQDSLAEIQLFQWVMEQPPQFRPALMAEHDLYKFVPQIIEAQATTVEPTGLSVSMPTMLMEQSSIGEQNEASIDLDTSWFAAWELRSGLICGESGDGKTKTLIYVLARFLQVNACGQCEVYIGDPDYGSSHGDAEPNNWLGLKLGTHVAVEPQDIYRMVAHVSGIVDARAGATAKATSDGNGKPKFPPVLFILDEAPAVMNMLDKESKDDFKAEIANILRRGLKQNVTFKLGTQSLAVGSLALPQDILRQVETVILWRAAQVKENYGNLGIQPKQIDAACDAIATLPRKVGDKFVCAVFVGKQLQVKGIPTIGDISVSTDSVSGRESPAAETDGDDIYGQILTLASAEGWDLGNGLSEAHRKSLKAAFDRLTGQNLTSAGIDALIEYLQKL
jgi:hypothetical protein